MRKKLLLLVLILLLIPVSYFYYKNYNNLSVSIKGVNVKVRLAKTPKETEQGLSGVTNLGKNEGMLFLMGKKNIYTFWMKDMKIPLDIIWIADNKIVYISSNVPVEDNSQLTLYHPKQAVNYVLEVNSGFCHRNNINPGDAVEGIDRIKS